MGKVSDFFQFWSKLAFFSKIDRVQGGGFIAYRTQISQIDLLEVKSPNFEKVKILGS